MDRNLKSYLDTGKYLPKFMRDFHDQKKLFKRLNEITRNRQDNYTKDVDWVAAQVYTIDIFLWYMAAHGYTLQKNRKNVSFYDVNQDLSEFEKKEQEKRASVLKKFKHTDSMK